MMLFMMGCLIARPAVAYALPLSLSLILSVFGNPHTNSFGIVARFKRVIRAPHWCVTGLKRDIDRCAMSVNLVVEMAFNINSFFVVGVLGNTCTQSFTYVFRSLPLSYSLYSNSIHLADGRKRQDGMGCRCPAGWICVVGVAAFMASCACFVFSMLFNNLQ